MFTHLTLQVDLGSVPSSQSSYYRSPWWVWQSVKKSLEIPIAVARFTDFSLKITPYKEDGSSVARGGAMGHFHPQAATAKY